MFDADFILALFCAVVAVFCLVTWLRVLALAVTDVEGRRAVEKWLASRRKADNLVEFPISGPQINGGRKENGNGR